MLEPKSYLSCLVLAVSLSSWAPARAQTDDSWETTVAIYILAAAMDGEVGIGAATADVDVSFSDILENLKAGMMGAYSISRGPLTIGVDVIYMDLEAGRAAGPNLRFDAEAAQSMIAVDAGYRLSERFEVLGGLRYNNLDARAAVSTPLGAVTGEDDEDWVDPYIGARWSVPIGQRWDLTLRGDVGGFGVGAESAWQVVSRLDWHLGESFDVLFGYRIIDADYEDGVGPDRFVYDVQSSGPMAGIAWRF